MVLQVEKTYKTKNSNTYSTVAEFVAEHGPCGRDNLEHIQEQGTAVLVGNDSMKVTVKYNNEMNTLHMPQLIVVWEQIANQRQ